MIQTGQTPLDLVHLVLLFTVLLDKTLEQTIVLLHGWHALHMMSVRNLISNWLPLGVVPPWFSLVSTAA